MSNSATKAATRTHPALATQGTPTGEEGARTPGGVWKRKLADNTMVDRFGSCHTTSTRPPPILFTGNSIRS